MFKKLKNSIRYKKNLHKYKDHSCDESFNWQWDTINFNRIALVNLLINEKNAQSYLEIGCQANNLFNSVPVINKIGVDPEVGGNQKMTSDEFFAINDKKFDVIFIDGLHNYQQIRKDIINSIKCLNNDGWIALHDMMPGNWVEAHVPNISSGAWFGDVWKVAFELSKTPGVDFKIIKIDGGVGVFKIVNDTAELVDMRNKLNNENFEYLYHNFSTLTVVDWFEASNWIKESK